MREIKFRGLTFGFSPRWVYGDLEHGYKPGQIVHLHIRQWNGEKYITEVRPNTVGQFAGFKDANGTEIYEGDLCYIRVKLHDHGDVEEFDNVEVYYDQEIYGFLFGRDLQLNFLELRRATIRVTGSIYL